MKIRSQFSILLILIIAIPVFCALFFPAYNYFTSPNRVLIEGTQQINKRATEKLSDEDLKKISAYLSGLPLDVQTAIFSETFEVLSSTIPELQASNKLNYTLFWNFIEDSSSGFFYQFIAMETEASNVIILTRVPKNKGSINKKYHMAKNLIIFLFLLVVACVITITFISRTIFNSIAVIEKHMQDIADGNLNVKIENKQKNKNEITSITDSLERMRYSLEDAQTRQNKFIMGISHDLRTPVAIIKGYTEAISDGMVSEEEMEKTLSLISTKTSQLETMINSLIDFMKLQTKDWRANLKCESISTLINNFAQDACITGTVFKRNITADINLKDEICVPLDAMLVNRCFENILMNAIRYTKENDKIEIVGLETEDSVKLKIRDEGEGMSEEDINHLFDLFYRGTNSRREEGMGIGLSVVKSIICTFNWEIDVKSKLGEGSEFTITIPKNKKD
ncbi:MAG: HAMP domain-containing histidine kinase [Treponema sp.]|nr:HAMP domain-containing histidine kinase [Treponema sp.]